jgi:hypothetical protein
MAIAALACAGCNQGHALDVASVEPIAPAAPAEAPADAARNLVSFAASARDALREGRIDEASHDISEASARLNMLGEAHHVDFEPGPTLDAIQDAKWTPIVFTDDVRLTARLDVDLARIGLAAAKRELTAGNRRRARGDLTSVLRGVEIAPAPPG